MRRSAAAGVVALALATGLAGQSRFQVVEKTIDDIHASMKSGNLTARELIQAYLDRIDAFDKKGPAINCIRAQVSLHPCRHGFPRRRRYCAGPTPNLS